MSRFRTGLPSKRRSARPGPTPSPSVSSRSTEALRRAVDGKVIRAGAGARAHSHDSRDDGRGIPSGLQARFLAKIIGVSATTGA